MRVVFVLTSIGRLELLNLSTGPVYEALAAPYYVFKDRNVEVVLASPAGGPAPVDRSADEAGELSPMGRRFNADRSAREDLSDTLRLDQVCPDDFDAAFYPGGHGALWDLATDRASKTLITALLACGRSLALLSHAPIVLGGLSDGAGKPIVAGRRMTAFSDAEEAAGPFAGRLPTSVETELKRLGARYSSDPGFSVHWVKDGGLITGQNALAAEAVAQALFDAIN